MIPAKEKALELFEKMSVIHYIKLGGKNAKSKGLPVSMYRSQIIQCALNCVDEIMEVAIKYAGKDYDYYKEVKRELEKLEKYD